MVDVSEQLPEGDIKLFTVRLQTFSGINIPDRLKRKLAEFGFFSRGHAMVECHDCGQIGYINSCKRIFLTETLKFIINLKWFDNMIIHNVIWDKIT